MSYLIISNRRIKGAAFFEGPAALDLWLSKNGYTVLIFAFWSHMVPKWMLEKYTCYGLHIGPLLRGMGRGGSPIENLKAHNVKVTTLCAFRMTEKIDGGPVELAIPIYVDKSKDEIVTFVDGMLPYITEYLVTPQVELPKMFKRIK